jgi:hypothetical protein
MAAAGPHGSHRRVIPTSAAPPALALVTLLLAVTSCTYADREPGLLERHEPDPPPRVRVTSPPTPSLPATNPRLPVAGEATWTSADGWQVQVRIAVHALRRMDGATVLDWSVTPIEAPNLRPGDLVPEGFDLGLSRPDAAGPDIALVDTDARLVYRPLTGVTDSARCLCTPVAAAQATLRVGVTTLLQTAYPPLPTGLRDVDVSVATVPAFWRVPVTPARRAPVADRPTDLARGVPEADLSWTEMFRYGPGEQVFRLAVVRVVASSTFTSLEWAIASVTGGDGVASASTPPFAARDAATGFGRTTVAASGPTIRVAGRRERLRPAVARQTGDDACLCTDLRGWPSVLRRPDKLATVVTTYPALPPGTRRVEVVFAGHPSIPVAVTPAVGPVRTATSPTTGGIWVVRRDRPATGWPVADWPTPVPDARQLDAYEPRVDRLLA